PRPRPARSGAWRSGRPCRPRRSARRRTRSCAWRRGRAASRTPRGPRAAPGCASSLALLEALERERVAFAGEILCERGAEGLRIRRASLEQRHRGAELEVVGMGKDILRRAALEAEHDVSALAQPRAEDAVLGVGARLLGSGDRVLARHRAPAEA